ncbi:MAG: hypothetical protein CSA62_12910 [Planctomycetota bacterium]|nr:MAG: hypothetical protein CSA62_12910 [Planctomycetota bacterium]
MYRLFLASRYALKRPIMLLGMIGVLLGIWSLTVVPGIFSGYLQELRKHLSAASGDLTLITIDRRVPFSKIEKIVMEDPAVEAIAPRLVWYGAITADRPRRPESELPPITSPEEALRDQPKFYQVIGIDWQREDKVTSLRRWIDKVSDAETRLPLGQVAPVSVGSDREEDAPSLLLGQATAEAEDLQRGAKLRLTSGSQRRSGDFHAIDASFTMSGSFSAGFYRYERATAFADIRTMRRLLYPGNEANPESFSEAAIRLKPGRDLDAVRARIERNVRERAEIPERDIVIWTWERKNSSYLDWIESQRGLFRLVLFVLIVVSALLIFVTLLMMVGEKTRDIGILATLGGTRRGIAAVFVFCALIISSIGVALGALLGWVSCRYLDSLNLLLQSQLGIEMFPKQIYGLEHVPYRIEYVSVASFGAAAIALSLLFALWPAWRAASYDPAKALRYD